MSAVVLAVLKENGDPVKRGDLLVRLDQTVDSRQPDVRRGFARAPRRRPTSRRERQFQRMKKLRETGVVSAQQVEDVEIRRNTAQSDREAARTRVVTARQMLERTEVRAPFDGIVSDRKVSAGDTAAGGQGTHARSSIRPACVSKASSRPTASAKSTTGQHVQVPHPWLRRSTEFAGTVTRVNPAANATTRQVEVLVAFDDRKQQPAVAGLYAEGHIETRSSARAHAAHRIRWCAKATTRSPGASRTASCRR